MEKVRRRCGGRAGMRRRRFGCRWRVACRWWRGGGGWRGRFWWGGGGGAGGRGGWGGRWWGGGGQGRGRFALGGGGSRGGTAVVSHHLGDLDDHAAYRAFERDIGLYEELFDIRPRYVVHDMHPDYASTGYARRRAAAEGLGIIEVQHHHAHMASCMAEHNLTGPVIGVSFDGTGWGTDGAIWGGEFLVGDYRRFTRAAHLRYAALPGGEAAVREPWRMALAYWMDARAACPSVPELP